MIFTKLLGIRSTESAKNEKHVKVLSSGSSGDVVELDSFISKRSDSYLCQGMNLIFPMCCMQFNLFKTITETCGNSTVINKDNVKPVLITSPGYPNLYKANVECVWSIYNDNEQPLSVYFADIHLEKQTECIYDYVEIVEVNATEIIERLLSIVQYR